MQKQADKNKPTAMVTVYTSVHTYFSSSTESVAVKVKFEVRSNVNDDDCPVCLRPTSKKAAKGHCMGRCQSKSDGGGLGDCRRLPAATLEESCEGSLHGDRVPVGRATEEGLTEEGLTEEGLTEEGLTEEGLTEEGLTEEGLTEEGLTEEGLTEEGLTEEGLTEEGVVIVPFACGHSRRKLRRVTAWASASRRATEEGLATVSFACGHSRRKLRRVTAWASASRRATEEGLATVSFASCQSRRRGKRATARIEACVPHLIL